MAVSLIYKTQWRNKSKWRLGQAQKFALPLFLCSWYTVKERPFLLNNFGYMIKMWRVFANYFRFLFSPNLPPPKICHLGHVPPLAPPPSYATEWTDQQSLWSSVIPSASPTSSYHDFAIFWWVGLKNTFDNYNYDRYWQGPCVLRGRQIWWGKID